MSNTAGPSGHLVKRFDPVPHDKCFRASPHTHRHVLLGLEMHFDRGRSAARLWNVRFGSSPEKISGVKSKKCDRTIKKLTIIATILIFILHGCHFELS